MVSDAGIDEREASRPSRRSSISSEDFFEATAVRSLETPAILKQFLDEVATLDVRAEYLASLNLKWDQPEGSPVNLGYVRKRGDVWTDASYWQVDGDLAEDYNQRLARLFGGQVRTGRRKKDGSGERWVARKDGTPFLIEDIVQHLSGWASVIEDFQSAIRSHSQAEES